MPHTADLCEDARMRRPHSAPAAWAALALAAWVLHAPPARADILPSPCTVDAYQRYLGERCLACEASEYEPERCRDAHAAAGLVQRCAGSPLGSTSGLSMWSELWCLPRGTPDDVALPPALPLVERVPEADSSPGTLPQPPPGFTDPPPLAPPINVPAPDAPADPPPPIEAAPPAPAAAAAPAPAGCGCRTGSPDLLLAACLPLLARRRRR